MKSLGLAAVLSFFICSLGQIYNGQIVKGLIFLVAYFISWWMMYIIVGFITTPILWILGIVDAYRTPQRIDTDVGVVAPF